MCAQDLQHAQDTCGRAAETFTDRQCRGVTPGHSTKSSGPRSGGQRPAPVRVLGPMVPGDDHDVWLGLDERSSQGFMSDETSGGREVFKE